MKNKIFSSVLWVAISSICSAQAAVPLTGRYTSKTLVMLRGLKLQAAESENVLKIFARPDGR